MTPTDLTSFDIGMPAGTPDPEGEDMDILLDVPDAEMPYMEEGTDVEVDLSNPPEDHYANLAELMEDEELGKLASELVSSVEEDETSMEDWTDLLTDGMKLLGFQLAATEDEVFPDSCTAVHPVLAESIIKYQAKARSQILRPEGLARAKILGKSTPEKKAQAERVAGFLNYQVQDQMPEYGPEHDRMLFHQAFAGSAYTKIFYDATLKRPSARFIKPTKFIISYDASDLESAYRYTEVMNMTANELKRYQLDGIYRRIEDEDMEKGSHPIKESDFERESNKLTGRTATDTDDIHTLYEIHTYLALDNEAVDDRTEEEREIGLELPYIITVDTGSNKVLAIRRNWKQGDTRYTKRVWFVHWPFIPGFGFQGFGYIHLIGGLARTATSSMRQLIDSGSFATLQGGFKVHGLRVVGNNEPISPGEWRDVQAPGMDLSKALHPLPYKEPSATLMSLLEFVVSAAQRFADSTEQVVSESTNYGPVGTTLALLEASGRLFTGIHERLFESQKRELGILMDINAETLGDQYPFEMVGGQQVVARADFDARPDVVPVTDPREPTAAHRVARANATLSVAGQFPDLHNMPAVLEDLHTALGAEDAQRYIKKPPMGQSFDPVTENGMLLVGMPVMATPEQNHLAHIKVHLMIVENELYASNEQVVPVIMAHVQQHLAENFKQEMLRSGVRLPPPGQKLPPQVENEIAAQAANVVAQMEASGALVQDPKDQLKAAEEVRKRQELKLKAVDTKRKEKLARDEMAMKDRHHKDEMRLKQREISTNAAVGMVQAKEKAKASAKRPTSK